MTLSISIVFAVIAGLLAGAAVTWMMMRSLQRAHVETIAERLKSELHETNARIAQTQRDTFLSLANERFSAVVAPVQQKLSEFDALVKAIEKDRIGAYEGLREQISGLIERSGKMETAASQLTSALRNPTTRGKWGEMQLRRVVELAGMEAYCDYNEQQTFDVGEDRGRPDMTVALPGNSKIFVDAKVPLNAYLDAAETDDGPARREKMRAHAAAFKSHVDMLARRNYQRVDGSADFVVMFVPGEAFLSAACTENPDLIEYGAGKDVYIASPLTLIALLRSYALGWQQRQQEENAKKIAEAGRALYDRVRTFAAHFVTIGSSLQKATEAYNKAVGSMESRVLPAGRKLKELASLPDAELPDLTAIETAPREITALDGEPPAKSRGRQTKLFTDDSRTA
ncbi:MAG TPA: DNA recombination protein RmuC [Candidatus Baltobacteraceae bacterium]|nr:DNA recombination protein RmuC [Candidatus Baltobacteraceae bacterium]